MANLGTDTGDFNTKGTLISGRRLHATDLAWRFRTPEGSLETDRFYGYDLAQHLNDTLEPERLPAIANRCELECLKDERTLSASVHLALEKIEGVKMRLRMIVDISDAAGPFRFVVSVTSDDFTLEILGNQ